MNYLITQLNLRLQRKRNGGSGEWCFLKTTCKCHVRDSEPKTTIANMKNCLWKCHSWQWILYGLILLELTAVLFFFKVGSRVYTDRDGTWAQELWFDESGYSPNYKGPTVVKPYLIQIDASRKPASLLMRYAYGNGRYYMMVGEASLVSSVGETLWSKEFECFTYDLGPNVFACAFADADDDGSVEIFYRYMETDYLEKEHGTDASWKISPLHIVQLDKRDTNTSHSLRSMFIKRVIATRLAFSLFDGFKKLGILLLLLIPPCTWIFLLVRNRI